MDDVDMLFPSNVDGKDNQWNPRKMWHERINLSGDLTLNPDIFYFHSLFHSNVFI